MVGTIKISSFGSPETYVIFFLAIIFIPAPCTCSIQSFKISPGFQGAQMNFIDNNGLFLLSNDSNFAFGFINTNLKDTTNYVLAIVHQSSNSVVWTANNEKPVTHSDNFVFAKDGNAYLQSGTRTIWSTNTSSKGVLYMELLNSGNLVLLSSDDSSSIPAWQSFTYPTDTILSGQNFVEGMKLISRPNSNSNLSFSLEFRSGNLFLSAGFKTPQPYWSMKQDNRRIVNKYGENISSATLNDSTWNLYDKKGNLLWQFIVASNNANDSNIIWVIILGDDGILHFYGLQNGASKLTSQINIPEDSCDAPEACGPYFICNSGRICSCPGVLSGTTGCNPGISSCTSNDGYELANVGDGIGYFATRYSSPFAKSNLTGCKSACVDNCSCVAMFFDEKSNNCFLFDQIGSLQQLDGNSNYSSFIKVSSNGRQAQNSSAGSKQLTLALAICFCALAVICGLVYMSIRLGRRHKRLLEPVQSQNDSNSEEDNFLDSISGVPVRFSYKELQEATDDFSIRLGQGGFGSVYLGKLKNGYEIAVKKLEGIGQGKKEFRAEVTTIGSIHHIHLVKLRGFCAEGTHRLLAYEYMANGSLERWIFSKSDEEKSKLDWDTRYNIALGTAKGLAYLHEDCDVKIVHCDIKPENVLLDENFTAKVSDFGLAKLMTREQSHVFTTMRGTRGYLAPEWITNYAISERSDVYSFGMVLLEIIAGRKNFDPSETSEKAHFPSYAFKMMEEGRLREAYDKRLTYNEKDERMEVCVKVALWCIQEDLGIRPSMAKVVQMMEGVSYVAQPPSSPQLGFRMYANLFKAISEEEGGSSSGPSDCNSDAFLSAVRLSGPR